MRIFVSINFSEAFRLKIARIMGEIQKSAEHGNFSRIQNLHVTLQFIGETERVEAAKEALEAVDCESFRIRFDKISGFKSRGAETLYLGVSEDTELKRLSEKVGAELSKRGFILEKRPFTAHLTLGREVSYKKGFTPESIYLSTDLEADVDKISLMKSERIKGILTYSEISAKILKKI
jgi:2''-5'' RNA ligase